MIRRLVPIVASSFVLWATPALAWGPDGHHTVGALAARLIAGSHAQAQVTALLGDLSLEDAAVWADCAKGVDPSKGFKYTSPGRYPECAIYETPDGEAAMIDYVKRNDTNCTRAPTDGSCHTLYHYADEAVQRTRYHAGDVGTRDSDVVAAIGATVAVLQGRAAPAPFDIKDKREALLLLAHFVGDIHQPLHVGAVYLDAQGRRVDPGAGPADPATQTAGGNDIVTIHVPTNRRSDNLHATWDAIPASLDSTNIDAAWVARARLVPRTAGPVDGWPAAWATTTLHRATSAISGLHFGPEQGSEWTTTLSCAYDDRMTRVKRQALTEGGARLAQLLQAIWP